jgi:glycosyltransferase involved in cell wall biosynthesis
VPNSPVELTLVIPAYNEADRLPSTLQTVLTFLRNADFTWELLLADDGSVDGTPAIAAAAEMVDPNVHHLQLAHRGKAAAIREGVNAATGQFIIFTDADLSTPIEYVDQAFALLQAESDIVIGTREAPQSRRIGEPEYRHVMGRVYNAVVKFLVVPGINDTQCGFKGFRADVARDLFQSAQLYRNGPVPVRGPLVTGFDIELLFLARKRGYRIHELPVVWRHVKGSNVRPLIDTFRMLRDALQVRLNDLRGRYVE